MREINFTTGQRLKYLIEIAEENRLCYYKNIKPYSSMRGKQVENEYFRCKGYRYNSSVIDANALLAGQEYNRLPETYVIFITENDLIGLGNPIYHIDRTIRENGEQFGDGSHILYVNGEYDGKNSIGKLMHDFRCKNPDDMNYKELV